MPDRRTPLANGEFYHVYNRGVAKQPTFLDIGDYRQALLGLSYYRFIQLPMKLSRFKELASKERENVLDKIIRENNELTKIVSFVFMPNHFHFLLTQTLENGISKFLSNFTNSYTRYFNTKHERVGPIFQGIFKAVRIETNEQLLHVSRYIHLNPVVAYVIKEKNLFAYPWSSLPDYLRGKSSLVWMDPVLDQFSTPEEYKKFVVDHIDYAKKLEQIKHLIIEEE